MAEELSALCAHSKLPEIALKAHSRILQIQLAPFVLRLSRGMLTFLFQRFDECAERNRS